MNTHTPGPWTVQYGCDQWGNLCKLPTTFEHAANARLIAAAPDMLAALKPNGGLSSAQGGSNARCQHSIV